MRSSLILNARRDRMRQNRPLVEGSWVENGTVVSHRCGGGGGFGQPSKRDRQRVVSDLANGYISPVAAERDYGVTDGT